MPNDTLRERRAVLIAAQQLVQRIDDAEDALERFHAHDQPAYTNWLREHFEPEREEIAHLESELTAAVQMHNQMVALTQLEGITMAEALKVLRDENDRFDEGDEDTRAKIALARAARDRVIREEFEKEIADLISVEPVRVMGEMDQEKLKMVYRKLVRRLHPDLQGPHIDATETRWQKRIWLISQTARAAGDVAQLEAIYKVNLLRQLDMGDFNLADALETREWLEKELARQDYALNEARRHAGFGFTNATDLVDLERRTRAEFGSERQFLLGEIEELRGQHALLERPRLRRTRKRPVDERQLSFFD